MADRKYKFARKIASGGMAEVLLAVQQGIGGFEKLVVLKRILPHLCQDRQFVEMLLAEARLAASLRHPNIINIFDIERDHDVFQIVMEYLSGEDLGYILGKIAARKDHLPIAVTCRIASDLAAGLDYAHISTDLEGRPNGVVHRDVSPGNIIVTYDGVTRLVDFGVAKANAHNIYTRPGTLKGKFGYASPEQIQHLELDGRSDIFSLGTVVYEMLTSTRLFHRSTPAAVLKAVMEAPIVPPSALNPEVPLELDALVLSALERERDQRIQTAMEFGDRIEQIGQGLAASTSSRAVASWMRATFKERYQERKELEQSLAANAQEEEDWQPRPQLSPMFAPSAAGSGSLPISNFDAATLAHRTPVSGSSPAVFSGVQPVGTGPEQGRRKIASLIIVLALTLVASLIFSAYWMGRSALHGTEQATGGGPTSATGPELMSADRGQRSPGATEPSSQPSAGPTSLPSGVTKEPPTPATPMPQVVLPPMPPAPDGAHPTSRRDNRRYQAQQARFRAAWLRAQQAREAARREAAQRTRATTAERIAAQRAAAARAAAERAAAARAAAARAAAERAAAERAAAERAAAERAAAERAAARAAAVRRAAAGNTGVIRVLSDSPGNVFVDGQNIGRTTPVKLRLTAGEHEIVVQLRGSGARIRKLVRIKVGKTVRLLLRN